MGLHVNVVHWINSARRVHALRGLVCTLAVQDIAPDTDSLKRIRGLDNADIIDSRSLFAALGFVGVESLDVSDYQGADYIYDLNDNVLPPHLAGRYDLVINGGTLEHVFHIPNALMNVSRLLKPGGSVLHILPCHNWVDHGFYQFSPTLMFDYYRAAGFEALESALASFALDNPAVWLFQPARPGEFGSGLSGGFDRRVFLHLFLARRGGAIDELPRPIQSLYASETPPPSGIVRSFPPYVLDTGGETSVATIANLHLRNGITRELGFCWRCELPQLSTMGDSTSNPRNSSLFLLEDDDPLGPPHMVHETIRKTGRGTYSHWGGSLYFSTSDNSSPLTNGRRYRAIIYDLERPWQTTTPR